MVAAPEVRAMASRPVSAQAGEHLPLFGRMAKAVSRLSGRPATFLFCCLLVVVWAATGPIFHYSDTWQLVINTGTTIITFLMVFLIQNTQNRDGLALQVKLDELIRATKEASNDLVSVEREPDRKVEAIKREIEEAARNPD